MMKGKYNAPSPPAPASAYAQCHVRIVGSGEAQDATQDRRPGTLLGAPPPRGERLSSHHRDLYGSVDQFAAYLATQRGNGNRGLAEARGEDVEACIVELLSKHKPAPPTNRTAACTRLYRLESEEINKRSGRRLGRRQRIDAESSANGPVWAGPFALRF
jgi:hypothetical protein